MCPSTTRSKPAQPTQFGSVRNLRLVALVIARTRGRSAVTLGPPGPGRMGDELRIAEVSSGAAQCTETDVGGS
jgi:hypothetical protein